MKRINYEELVRQLSEKSQNAVDRLLSDEGVHFLILLKSESEAKPKILPAGPKLDFRTPKDAAGQIIRGMRAVAYVDLQAEARQGTPGGTPNAGPPSDGLSEKVRELESKIVWYENEISKNQQLVRKARRVLKEKDIKIAELTKRNEMLNARMDEYNCSGDLDTEKRMEDIESAENQLIDRMNELMRKEAEIEQKEEDLLRKESKQQTV